ncbi:hypothetical protein HZS_7570 [Henneguya salminicola]|uniref:Phosphomannomutase n=1 Tax=Henneguya salminicola TaxID=69463 RepID=A0A6G3MDU6_HENSL|nr:hypothetical protein HZS_7570 [Henneguya salminicola]
MINICPIGRNCSLTERKQFAEIDRVHGIREKFVSVLKQKFGVDCLKFSIGGQISIDIFPIGWDKSYCLNHLNLNDFQEIHFFGDRTLEGENDYELYIHSSVIPHSVIGPEDTINKISDLFKS